MYEPYQRITVFCEVVSLVHCVLSETKSQEVRQLPLELSYHSIALLFFTDRELQKGWCDVDTMLSHHIVALTTFLKLFFILFILIGLVENLFKILIWFCWPQIYMHFVEQK